MTETIHIEKGLPRGIPVLTVSLDETQAAPIVFFIHGFGENKEKYIQVGYQLAKAGFFAVLVDAYLHGERLGTPLDNLNNPARDYIYPPGTGFDTWQVMFSCALQTASDLNDLMDYFSGDPRVNTSQVGVTGFSMGGFTTYLAAATNPRITTVVSMGAYPSIQQAWRNYALEAAAYSGWADQMTALWHDVEQRADWFGSIDPFLKMKDTYQKPLLMIVGEIDTDAPKVYSLPLFAALRKRYQQHPDWIKLNIYDGIGHMLTNEMITDAVNWFRRFLF